MYVCMYVCIYIYIYLILIIVAWIDQVYHLPMILAT